MKAYLPVICIGVFAVMALSNAIVPVLPSFADESSWEGAIYAAYFFGAFLLTLPGGILSDRYGRLPVIRTGLILTVVSGFFLFSATAPVCVISLRFLEGLGAGLFVAAGMSYVNSQPDHTRISGYYLAMLNIGLVLGLVASGWLAVRFMQSGLGIGVFTALSFFALAVSFLIREPAPDPAILQQPQKNGSALSAFNAVRSLVGSYRWLWYSTIVLVGITGVISSLYPDFSNEPADILGFWIAGMSIATIVTVLVVSRFPFPAICAIRWSAIFMAGGVIIAFVSPVGFLLLGALAGIVMIAQLSLLADVRDHQGIVMGLFSTCSYLGMAILPFIAGLVTDAAGFFNAFLVTALLGVTVALSIGWNHPTPDLIR
ncbi:MAG: MFS transporter [Methanoregula sp.]|nr:MFS transporter [Methanoregula sp.]